MKNRIKILDCTLRDGGLGLEDAYKNQIADISFKETDIDNVIEHLKKTNIDIIELGSIEVSDKNKKGYAIYQNLEEVSKTIPSSQSDNQMYVALYRGPDTPLKDIPVWRPGFIEGIRVILRYSELEKSLKFCAALSSKGYKVFVQPMLTMRYTEHELQMIIDATNDMHAYALYFVDSYGYMTEEDVKKFFQIFDKGLNKDICIGFHAHNNMNLAYSNALSFIKIKTERFIIIDACASGMGQGAGNLQTELIANYMIEQFDASYNYEEILEVCENIEVFMSQSIWGYSVTRLLSAINKTAYKYSVVLRNKYGLKFKEINKLLSHMPEELKQRYTSDNSNTLYENYCKINNERDLHE